MNSPFAYRRPDGSIDLEAALGPALRHYVAVMVSGAGTFLATAPEGAEDGTLLVRHGYGGPSRASSRGTVALRPEVCWDVAGYYRALGVHWRAAKGAVRRAYVAACARPGGQEQSEYLTYVTAQLLDEGTRRAYDMVPLGGVFVPDREIQDQIRRAAVRESVRRRTEDGEEYTPDQVMEEMGVYRPGTRQGADAQGPAGGPQEPPGPPPSRWAAQWGHYAVAGPQGAVQPDGELLEQWQGLVAAALRERGIVMEFAVAQGPEGAPLVLRNVNESCIFVMTRKGISPQQATRAIEMGITLGMVTDNTERGN